MNPPSTQSAPPANVTAPRRGWLFPVLLLIVLVWIGFGLVSVSRAVLAIGVAWYGENFQGINIHGAGETLDGIEVQVDMPNRVTQGEEFEVRVTVTNHRPAAQSLYSINFSNYGAWEWASEENEITDLQILRSDPPQRRSSSMEPTAAYFYQRIERNETAVFRLTVRANQPGYFRGTVWVTFNSDDNTGVERELEVIEATKSSELPEVQ